MTPEQDQGYFITLTAPLHKSQNLSIVPTTALASHADILWALSRVPSPRTAKAHFPDLEVWCDWSMFFYRSFQRTFVGEDGVTSLNNVCVEGYHFPGIHSTLRAKKSDSCFARKIRRALQKFARYKTVNCYWNRTDKKTRHFYLVPIFACFKSRRMLYEITTTIFRPTMLAQCCYNPKQCHNNVASLLPICPLYSTPQFCSREWTWLHKNWIVSITRYFWSGNHSSSSTFGSRRPIARYK